jgi:hypothetical protein
VRLAGAVLKIAPRSASKRIDRYVYNAQFLERLKLRAGAIAWIARVNAFVHTSTK